MSTSTSPHLSSDTVRRSYAHCQAIAKERAKNFYYSFLLLEEPKRAAMCAVYAFMRRCDDLSDETGLTPTAVEHQIALWRVQLDRALHGLSVDDPLWPAFCDTVRRYSIPHRFFHEMIDGVMSDVHPQRIRTYEELYQYCYRVASVVGLAIIHIFGFTSTRALLLAEKCGIAFQLTNILRDVREDASMDRVYLPAEDLKRFGITLEHLKHGTENARFRGLMKFQAARARACYHESADLLDLIDRQSRRSLWALRSIYQLLLWKIEHKQYAVLSQRIGISKPVKLMLLLAAFLRS